MKQITEDYVSYEIAVLLKKKGFDMPVQRAYNNKGSICETYCEHDNQYKYHDWLYPCATLQMALKWLREVHKLHIYAVPYWPQGDMRNKTSWQGFIVDLNTINGDSQCYANSSEEAIENRIKFTLENLI